MNTYVKFDDADTEQTLIVAASPWPQEWSNMAVIPPSDPRWKVFYDMLPEFIQGFYPAPE